MISEELFPWMTIGYFVVAALGGFVCFFWILGIAFSEGVMHGLGCLFCGPYGLYYCVTRWRQCKSPFVISLALNIGLVIVQFQTVDNQPMDALITTVEKYQKQARETNADRIARDQQALQGQWRLAIADRADHAGDFEEFEFTDDLCVVEGKGAVRRFHFVLARSSLGRTIDLTNVVSGETLEGLYRLSGDHFTLCVASPGESRPHRFATWGKQQRSFELKRCGERLPPERSPGDSHDLEVQNTDYREGSDEA